MLANRTKNIEVMCSNIFSYKVRSCDQCNMGKYPGGLVSTIR